MKEYSCPYCEDEIEVDDNDKSVVCKSCGSRWVVERDADFVDGMWKDLTKLHQD